MLRASDALDLRDAVATDAFYAEHRPTHVVLAAARVGGIVANQRQPVEFLHDNLAIQSSVIGAAARHGARRLLFLGSSCIYPKHAPQPLREDALLSGPLEATNRAYALAKIAGVEMCWAWNRQHGKRFLCVMPTNLYGPGDNWHPERSHVIPGLIRRFHEARLADAPRVAVWGSGRPRREFLHSDDLAAACLRLLRLPDAAFDELLGSDESLTGRFEPPVVNVGCGEDLTIGELAALVARVVGYRGEIGFDPSRPDGTPRKRLDVSRMASLGWRPTIALEEGLADAYRDFLRGERRGEPATAAGMGG